MPSITETFGLVYTEAMSQGMPVIYSEKQGFDGQFKEGIIGYHVNSFNAEEIAKKILKIISNYEKISRNCLKYSHLFDWKNISGKYSQIYNDILSSMEK